MEPFLSAEVIASGSELTYGDRVNTNAAWVSQELAGLNVRPRWHTTIGDELGDNIQALRIALNRADLIVMTGGLGPTQDDLTREALAHVTSSPLELRADLIPGIERIFSTRGIPMPERNRLQAYLPRDARAVPNHSGTAPGIWMEFEGKLLIALPGVPREMRNMWEQTVEGDLQVWLKSTIRTTRRKINLFGLGESAVEAKIMDLTVRGREPEVGITASEAVISLRITSRAATDELAAAAADLDAETIQERLGEYVFSEGDVSLAGALVDALSQARAVLAVVEVGGKATLLGRLLAENGSASHVIPALLAHGLSEDVSLNSIAMEAKEGTGARFCLAFSLAQDPAPGPRGPTSSAQIILTDGERTEEEVYRAVGSPDEILSRSVNFALHKSLRWLLRQSVRGPIRAIRSP